MAATQATPERPAALSIRRVTAPITVDGRLDDPGWQGVERVETWYEVNPGDNTPPKVRSVGYLAYDDRFFYAAFDFEDPRTEAIRAPLGDRDNRVRAPTTSARRPLPGARPP